MHTGDGRLTDPLVETLSRREREILALLAQGYTGPEIAEKLTIALSSVRTHLQNLYGKLGVQGKRSALNRAAALGLLAEPSSAAASRHNLPMALTRFFGREPEIAQIQELLAEYRLVTVTGAGGVGKTRLALRVAGEVLESFADGVWLVELAPLADPALVTQAVAVTLGVRESLTGDLTQAVVAILRQRQFLLILDNCEHLLPACARLADSLLRACPRLTILATSREPLAGDGEAVFLAPSLSFPSAAQAASVEAVSGFPSVRLFVDRARMLQPNYQVTSDNAAALSQICARVDGVPLAIEMAAARTNVLTAEQVAGRLDDAFLLLTSGRRTALPRQQTLRATIDWSYALLNEAERLVLQRLAVFAGGCTLEAAEAVCSGDDLEAGQMLDLLSSLVAKSLVICHRQGEATRYQMLEMVRQYAQERLNDAGEVDHLKRRHRDFWLVIAEQSFNRIVPTRERLLWGKKFLADRENILRALDWSFDDEKNVEAVPRLVIFLHACRPRAPQAVFAVSRQALAWCRSRKGISNLVYARLLGIAAKSIGFTDDLASGVSGLKEAVEISRDMGPDAKDILTLNLFHLGMYLGSQNAIEPAYAAFAEAEHTLSQLDAGAILPDEALWYKACFANARAWLANKQGRFSEAKKHAQEYVRIELASGQPLEEFGGQLEFGDACLGLGEYDEAREHFLAAEQRVLQNQRDYVEPQFEIGAAGLAYTRRCLGFVDLRQGNLQRANEYCLISLREAHKGAFRDYTATDLALAAFIWAKRGSTVRAAKLSGAAKTLYASTGRPQWEDTSLATLFPGWPDHPDYEAIAEAYAAGLAMSADEAVAYALGEAPPL